ncbi:MULTISPECIES: MarR family transcriptional regulator [Pandoraea]|uniref:MarR family winged helix-turn-helix transcriptional regulator n=1 Tax=Pandoraea TaxID=93217 RepID=UPI001F5CB3A8|nr:MULTISPECIES: MarR family transcriptional regulator [Pandoraea]
MTANSKISKTSKPAQTSLTVATPHTMRSAEAATAPHLELLNQTGSAALRHKSASVGLLMLWLSDDVAAHLNKTLLPHGVTEKKFDILMLFGLAERGLLDIETLTPTYISEYFDVTRSSVTGLLDWLEVRKLLARKSHKQDRRSFVLELTPKGRQLLNDALPDFWSSCESLVSVLSDEEASVLQTLLSKIWGHLKGHHADTPASAAPSPKVKSGR